MCRSVGREGLGALTASDTRVALAEGKDYSGGYRGVGKPLSARYTCW